jgi:hypothetical protein
VDKTSIPKGLNLILTDLLPKAKAELEGDSKELIDLVCGLIFSEMFLEIKLNSESSVSGLSNEGVKHYRADMTKLSSDSDILISFATLLRKMAEVQKSKYLEEVLEDWAKLFRRGPNAAQILLNELPTTEKTLGET